MEIISHFLSGILIFECHKHYFECNKSGRVVESNPQLFFVKFFFLDHTDSTAVSKGHLGKIEDQFFFLSFLFQHIEMDSDPFRTLGKQGFVWHMKIKFWLIFFISLYLLKIIAIMTMKYCNFENRLVINKEDRKGVTLFIASHFTWKKMQKPPNGCSFCHYNLLWIQDNYTYWQGKEGISESRLISTFIMLITYFLILAFLYFTFHDYK